ncbi:hypothetical protein LD85_2743 [Saccharolobus islandicus L.D.8.5]|uniref:Uncharacterized protein n=1 Tax=Saccharolobus islandicus (strain L.D.8.5 / Lassen \|nr:hypothetical protein LD85_2743 [Sulfolobus islandicus L.D.8.5]
MLAHYGIYAEIALVTEAILLQKLEVRGRKASPAGMDSLLYLNNPFF